MLDLVRTAYDLTADKVVGGPSWLEVDRFDVSGKVAQGATLDDVRPMLRTLMAERFALKTHKEKQPQPQYFLTAGKKPALKEANGTETMSGCKPEAADGGGRGGLAIGGFMLGLNGVTVRVGQDNLVTWECRNMSMKSFASNVRGFIGANLKGSDPVTDETGIQGNYDFDIKYSFSIGIVMNESTGHNTSLAEAIDKQLGLKLEERQVPTEVLVVDSVSRTPTADPPGTTALLPPIAVPKEFDVVSLKPTDPSFQGARFGNRPGGGIDYHGMTLQLLLMRAFNMTNVAAREGIVNLPAFVNTERFDVMGKTSGGSGAALNQDELAPLLLAVLKDRFELEYHMEDRPVTAYTLTAVKPKMKKASPNERTKCDQKTAPPGSRGQLMLTCQNATMEFFADRLRNTDGQLNWPITDTTKLEGGWDFSIVYGAAIRVGPMVAAAQAAAGAAGRGGDAAEPDASYTIFEALEKELGLKLVKQPRSEKVFVIDHLEQRPTEN
jgi:uncharacterized protein (TIGR03435 family)